jgi:putative endonuclease
MFAHVIAGNVLRHVTAGDAPPHVIASAAKQSQPQEYTVRDYWVYIMTNMGNTVLYTGVTNSLARRVRQHKAGIGSAFTNRYKTHKLVFYERFMRITDALAAEKRIKAGSRAKKIKLIEERNPQWNDLFTT